MLSVAPPKRSGKSSRRAGFAALAFEQFSAGLHRFLLRRVRHAEHAEDLEQEVYVRLLRISNEELVRCPEAYVYRIASNLLGRFTLRERQEPLSLDSEALAGLAEELQDDAPTPEELYDERGREERLWTIVMQLPPMQKAVFVLARYQGLSHSEIGAKLGISALTVKKHMSRAICRCRLALEDEGAAQGRSER